MRETSHEAALSLILREYCYKLRPLKRSRQLVADTHTAKQHTSKRHRPSKMTTITEEKKRHLRYLRKIKPRELEVQNVLSYSIEQFPEEKTRLEYMSFVEENNLQHSWAAMLAWWRFRPHTTDMDKWVRTAIKRTMELKKRQDYTLFSTCRRKHKSRQSPPLAVDPSPTKIPPEANNAYVSP